MIDILNPRHLDKLGRAIEYSYSNEGASERYRRRELLRIFTDDAESWYKFFMSDPTRESADQYLPLFQQYVRGHVLTLGYQIPRWQVTARMTEGRGFDMKLEQLLNYYFSVLDGTNLVRQWAIDTAFGDCVAKITDGPSPMGITAPVAPRVYRVEPNRFIRDRSATSIRDMAFFADLYLVPFDEAASREDFFPQARAALRPYQLESDDTRLTTAGRTSDAYPEEIVRLMDVYLPSSGLLLTYDMPNDQFNSISGQIPLRIKPMTVNPYEVCRLVTSPNSVDELSRLHYLRQLHYLANDMLAKAALQARRSKRLPVVGLGNETDLDNLLRTEDTEGATVSDMQQLDMYVLPGPDPAVTNLGAAASNLFSQQAGNLETSMGLSPGATTAKQTEAMLGQISAASSYDRGVFEKFLSNIGKKLGTLAFESEVLELELRTRVPGTRFDVPLRWAPPHALPRVGEITDYDFEVVPFSSAFRSPQERLAQLNVASQGILQWAAMAQQGAPVNLEAVTRSFKRAYDLIPEIDEWLSGGPQQQPPAQRAMQQYQSTMQHNPGGANVNYQSQRSIDPAAAIGLAAASEGLGGGLTGGGLQ